MMHFVINIARIRAFSQESKERQSLINELQTEYLIPPSKSEYNLKTPRGRATSMGQGQQIRKLFKDMRNGFFVECGALDGETRSNTLSLERDLDWTGVLIEGSPENVEKMKGKHRKSWLVPNCLSTVNGTFEAVFKSAFNIGRIVDGRKNTGRDLHKVKCFSLDLILAAIDRTHVDYFSLDVEGHEFEVLKTIPFDRLDITALSVEFSHVGEVSNVKGDMIEFMARFGYEMRAKVTHYNLLAHDYIFVKKGFNEDVKLEDIATTAANENDPIMTRRG